MSRSTSGTFALLLQQLAPLEDAQVMLKALCESPESDCECVCWWVGLVF